MIITRRNGAFLALTLALALAQNAWASPTTLTSPDKRISVRLHVTGKHTLVYSVSRDTKPVILDSSLGLEFDGADLAHGLSIVSASPVKQVRDSYAMAVGKRSKIEVQANEQTWTVVNARKQKLDVVFRVSNDGVAFRYKGGAGQLREEATAFAFDPATRAWLQPIAVAQTGWAKVNPSYEEHYQMDIAAGTPSPMKSGWAFPALFRTGDTWVALTEAGMDGSTHASRLQAESPGAVYRIGGPMAAEVFTGGALLPKGPLTTPWRVIALGSLATLTESTLGTDLAAPAIAFDARLVKPGHASWSWALMKDDATVYDVQKKFIDYAADMHWDYTLIDADWDRKIGYAKVKELVDYAATKQIGIILWYNSSGAWNETEYTPKGALLTHEQRIKEFARLREMGVKGVKVDFFGGDSQSMIAYYIGIVEDAAANGLLVNFHGATLPRGWARTYPNLMTAEAIRGLEFTTFDQKDEDVVATHAAMLPFTRNLFDPMDFTPVVFGDMPKIKRTTRNGFELAESVLFLSGIQHFAEIPEGMATVPAYVKSFLQELPRSWDDSRFVAGVPGKYAVIARRSGDTWYVAGINAQEGEQAVTLELPFAGSAKGVVITDGDTERALVQGEAAKTITMKSRGGFVAVYK